MSEKDDGAPSASSGGGDDSSCEDENGDATAAGAQTKSRKRRRDMSPNTLREYWQRKKQEKKKRKKERGILRQDEQRRQWEALSEAEREDVRAKAAAVHECRRRQEVDLEIKCASALANPSTPALLFDLSFADTMNAAGVKSTTSQLKFSYAILRRHGFPLRPIVTSLQGQFEPLRLFEGFRRFPPVTAAGHWRDLLVDQISPVVPEVATASSNQEAEAGGAEAGGAGGELVSGGPNLQLLKKSIVYLTADSDTVLLDIEPDTVYVVGAFVDHNSKKGATLELATHVGVRTARLPIDEFLKVGNLCKVLTINTVVDVLSRFCETKSWPSAFEALPTRRQE